ncbi:cation:proton antiporter subunit C [Leptolyngbya sp. CCNP1308]|uniref:cation:proton antiporter subunit C n=1 Tax=Leptolyngbya sp. CCNP1308 TaxID=3110255 RepID=UPI002B220683|nr:cation:proton antiporter subunit C [Leptolyngbya sp. CCNP1308]MEA5451654.1 cation:proton antiporter subunit C [Leptolyngbya sp. CCNP1308]
MLHACVYATILLGFFGIIFKENLVMKIIAMDVMSTGVIALFVLVAARTGVHTPILAGLPGGDYADPVPQAVILTAIVIGFSIQALMLVGVMKLARDNPTLETQAIEEEYRP